MWQFYLSCNKNLINNQYWCQKTPWKAPKNIKAEVDVTLKRAGVSVFNTEVSDQYADHTTERGMPFSQFIDLIEAM